jgi:hypothetical protein
MWHTWYPSVYWQQIVFALALIVMVVAMLMAVRPRSKQSRQKQI